MTTTGAAPSQGLHLSRSRGASGWRLRIYDALWEADQEGRTLTFQELVDECVARFNKSGTMQWWEIVSARNRELALIRDYREIVARKVRQDVNHMRKKDDNGHSEVINLGTRARPLYTIAKDPMKPPKYWHRRTYRPGHFKEYLPARADPEARKAARRMDSGWFAEVRMELAKPKPRGDRLRELLSEGLDIFGA